MGIIYGSPFYESVDELFGERGGTAWEAGDTGFNRSKREYDRFFRVRVKLKEMASVSSCIAPGIPLPYSFYLSGNGEDYDLRALCIKISAKEENRDDWGSWIVTTHYSTQMPPGGRTVDGSGNPLFPGTAAASAGATNNPELEPPEVEWDFEVEPEAPSNDLDGKPYTNSANMPFTPAPMFPSGYPILAMSRNELSFNIATAANYSFAVNSDTFMGFAPGTVFSYPPKAKRAQRGDLFYWRVNYRLKFSYWLDDLGAIKKFQPRILDQGMYKWTPGPIGQLEKGFISPIYRGATKLTQPDLLDGTGKPVVPNASGVRIPKYRNFRQFYAIPFASLLMYGMS